MFSKLLNFIPELWHTAMIWLGRMFVSRKKKQRRDDWRERRRKRRQER